MDYVTLKAKQEYSSENTSIKIVPSLFKKINWPELDIKYNFDVGGGKYNLTTEYLAKFGITNLIYEPSRGRSYNMQTFRSLKEIGLADSATIANVLNVIKEPKIRKNVLLMAKRWIKPNGRVFIQVYEGNGSGIEGQTTPNSYQLNRKSKDYFEEIKQVFPNVVLKNKIFYATK